MCGRRHEKTGIDLEPEVRIVGEAGVAPDRPKEPSLQNDGKGHSAKGASK
jgi:hypothetical protein